MKWRNCSATTGSVCKRCWSKGAMSLALPCAQACGAWPNKAATMDNKAETQTATRRLRSNCICAMSYSSKIELQRELHLPRRERTADGAHLRDIQCACLLGRRNYLGWSKGGQAADARIVGVIEGVEEFNAELEIARLSQMEVFQ